MPFAYSQSLNSLDDRSVSSPQIDSPQTNLIEQLLITPSFETAQDINRPNAPVRPNERPAEPLPHTSPTDIPPDPLENESSVTNIQSSETLDEQLCLTSVEPDTSEQLQIQYFELKLQGEEEQGEEEQTNITESQALDSGQIEALQELCLPFLPSKHDEGLRLNAILEPGETPWEFSLEQIFQISTAVANFYSEQGYRTSGAVIDFRNPSDEPISLEELRSQSEPVIARIEVIEGELEKIQVCLESESETISEDSDSETETQVSTPPICDFRLDDYVTDRLGVRPEHPLNVTRLQEHLQLLQLNPRIDQISATLAAGAKPGNTRLLVMVQPADVWSLRTTFDNARPPSVGSLQRQLALSKTSLLLPGDNWNATYLNTDGSNAFDTSYTFPLNASDGSFSLRYSRTGSSIIDSPFDRLDIESNSQVYEATIRQPFLQTVINPAPEEENKSPAFHEAAVGITGYLRDSRSELLGEPFPLSRGAEDDGRIRVVALRLFQDWTRRSANQVLAARSQFSFGLDTLDATSNEFDFLPTSNFFAWRGQIQWVRLLGASDRLFVSRLVSQIADRTVFSSEQFAAGGANTVRGYREDLLQSDNGLLASVEARLPLKRFQFAGQRTTFQVIPFIDVGYGWNNSGISEPDPSTLASIGLGLQLLQGDRFSARLDYGIPLISGDTGGDSWQENGVHFSLTFNPL